MDLLLWKKTVYRPLQGWVESTNNIELLMGAAVFRNVEKISNYAECGFWCIENMLWISVLKIPAFSSLF